MAKARASRKASAGGRSQPASDTARIGILGSGFSGLGMAIRLKQEGIDDFVLLEKADEVGGTWRENTYPGAACDVPSHLYCYSFEPKADWSRVFAPQAEILDYIRHCADKYGIRPYIRFGTEVTAAHFDDEAKRWNVHTRDGQVLRFRMLVAGKGALHVPSKPQFPGVERFAGPAFHSAEWDHSVDLTGKRVAVIGSGASAIQVVPAIVDRVAELHYYQRTPSWVLPRNDRAYTPREKRLFERFPALEWLHRQQIYWTLEPRVLGFAVDPRIMSLAARLGVANIAKHVKDRALRKKLTPRYTMGCKRTLLSDDYYPAVVRPNVEVVTDGIQEIRRRAIVTTDGRERATDVLVYCTGFKVSELLSGLDVRGVGGRELAADWSDGARTLYGITVSGYPNLFFLMGPNTGLGHNSMIYMIESQIHYVIEAIRAMDAAHVHTVDPRPEIQDQFTARIQKRLARSVWATGCQSWYLDEKGRNSTTWPGFTFEYRARTRRFDPGEYRLA